MPLLKLPNVPGVDNLQPPSAEQDAALGFGSPPAQAQMATASGTGGGQAPTTPVASTAYSRATGNPAAASYQAQGDATAGPFQPRGEIYGPPTPDEQAQQQFALEQMQSGSLSPQYNPRGFQQEVGGTPDQGSTLDVAAQKILAPVNAVMGFHPLVNAAGLPNPTVGEILGAPSAAVRAIPGEQSLPGVVRAPLEMLPYAATAAATGGLSALPEAAGYAAASGLGQYGAQQGVKALGGTQSEQDLAGLLGMVGGPMALKGAIKAAPRMGEAIRQGVTNTAPTMDVANPVSPFRPSMRFPREVASGEPAMVGGGAEGIHAPPSVLYDSSGEVLADTRPETNPHWSEPTLKNGDPLYRGAVVGSNEISPHGATFWSGTRQGADWYATERSFGPASQSRLPTTVLSKPLDLRNPANTSDLIAAIKETGITAQDFGFDSAHPFDPSNLNDYLYSAKIRGALAAKGFDGFIGWDVLENGEIPLVVEFDKGLPASGFMAGGADVPENNGGAFPFGPRGNPGAEGVGEEPAKLFGRPQYDLDASGTPVRLPENPAPAPATQPTQSYVSEFDKPLPPQPRIPETGQYPAIRTTDGGLYPDLTGGQQSTHLLFADRIGIPRAQVESTGWLVDGDYRVADTSPSWARQAKAAAHVSDSKNLPAPVASPAGVPPSTTGEVTPPPPAAPAGAGPESDLERQMRESMEMLKSNPAAAKDAFNQEAEKVVAAQQAEAAAKGAEYATATNLSKRAAEMAGADPATLRRKAVRFVSDALENLAKDESGSSTTGVLADTARGVASLPGELIALKSTLSPPALRQGKVRLVTAPFAWWRELKMSGAALKSEAAARGFQDSIASDPWVRDTVSEKGKAAIAAERFGASGESVRQATAASNLPIAPNTGYTWQDVGGHLLDWGDNVDAAKRVEDRVVQGNTAVGNAIRNSPYIKPFDRQAVIELNAHRTNWYKSVASNMWDAGERDVSDYENLRKFIEGATHRGAVPDAIQKLPLWFSARAQAGRVRFLWDLATNVPKAALTGGILRPGVQQEAVKALTGMVVANVAQMAALTALVGGSLKMSGGLPTWQKGAFHWDPWAGWNQQAKLIYGIGKDIASEGKFADGYGWENVPQDLARKLGTRGLNFAAKGLSPFYSTAVATATGKDYAGQPYNLAQQFRSGQIAVDWAAPFIAEEVVNAYKYGGPVGAAADFLPSFLSEGTNTYLTPSEQRMQIAQEKFGATGPTIVEQRDAGARSLGMKDYDSSSRAQKQQINDALGYVSSPYYSAAISTLAAVDKALQTNDAKTFGHDIAFNGLKRPVNQNIADPRIPTKADPSHPEVVWANTTQAWKDSKDLLDKYYNVMPAQYEDKVAQANYHKDFADLPQAEQDKITTALHTEAQKQSPQLDAWLAWWGGSDSLQSTAAVEALKQIIAKYGSKSPYPGFNPHLAAGAK